MLEDILGKLTELLRPDKKNELGARILEILRAGFAKNEPISSLQHCLSVALVAARLAEYMGYSEDDIAVAYAAGLFHDYEKLGPMVASLDDEEKIELLADHLDEMGIGDNGVARRALRIARGLEEGLTPLPDRKIERIVKLADYVMGVRYESSDPVMVANYIITLSQKLSGKRIEAYPILLGVQRPITLYAAEKVAEKVEECGGLPLVATPMGFVYLTTGSCLLPGSLQQDLAKQIVDTFSEQPTEPRRRQPSKRDPVGDAEARGMRLCDAVSSGKNPGSAVSMKRPPSQQDVEEVIDKLASESIPRGRRPYVLLGLFVYTAKLFSPEEPKKAIPVIASLFGVAARGWKDLAIALKACDGEVPEGYKDKLQKLRELLEDAAKKLSGGSVVEYLAKRLNEVVHVPFTSTSNMDESLYGGTVCSLCRAPTPRDLAREFTFKKYRDTLATAGISLAQEVFHPDVQGAPADTRIAEDVKKLPVCPLCFYEARYMASSGVVPGSWSTVIHYGPSVAYDLLQVARKVIAHRGNARVYVDPLSARLVAAHESPFLKKSILAWAFESWYLVGGSLALTRNPFTLPTPTSRIIYVDKADAVIEAIDSFMMNSLRRASWTRDYWREATYAVRRVAYQLLQLYVDSLEEARVQRKIRLRPSLRTPVSAPSLTVLALYTASKIK